MYTFFLKHFLRDPGSVGAIVPLSQAAVQELLKEMSERKGNQNWNILDAGAGIGNISEQIQKRMKDEDRLDLVEIDEECCELLRKKFLGDERIRIACMSILDWTPEYHYDFIVSTLPFQNFDAEMVSKILDHYMEISNEDALCSYIEYMGIGRVKELFAKEPAKSDIEKRRDLMSEFHKEHLLEQNSVYQNMLPSYVYHLQLHHHLKT